MRFLRRLLRRASRSQHRFLCGRQYGLTESIRRGCRLTMILSLDFRRGNLVHGTCLGLRSLWLLRGTSGYTAG